MDIESLHSAPQRLTTAKRTTAGFSLLELICVVVLIGILSSMVVPMFVVSSGRTQARDARDKLAAMIRHGREMAETTSTPHRLAFYEGGYELLRATADRGFIAVEGGRFVELPFKVELALLDDLDEDGDDYGDYAYMTFLPSGATFVSSGDEVLRFELKYEGSSDVYGVGFFTEAFGEIWRYPEQD